MRDEEVTERFNDIIEIERITNHPIYKQLMLELDLATARVFSFIEHMGISDVCSVKSVFTCPEGHTHDLFKHVDLLKEKAHKEEANKDED